MPAITLTVEDEVGLHARPAAVLVQTAQRYRSDIKVRYETREANAKSVLSMLALGVARGAHITIEAHGEDADQALVALRDLFERNCVE